jgi:hypothetical protein
MVFHPLRSPTFLLANSADSMKSWMTAMQSVKDFLALYDNTEDYTSSDDEVTCCGKGFSLPFRKKGLPPQIFDDYINESLSMNTQTPHTPHAPKNEKQSMRITCKYDASSSRDDAEVSIDIPDEEKIKIVHDRISKVADSLAQELNINLKIQFKEFDHHHLRQSSSNNSLYIE